MLRIVWPAVILFAAVGGAQAMKLARPTVAARPEAQRIVPVMVLRAELAAYPVRILALGEVKPVHRLVLQPEVGGRVVERNPALVPGGLLRAGEGLLRIDGRDHSVSVAVQAAALEQAAVTLVDERGRKQVAEFEWQATAHLLTEEARKLALRENHVRSAESGLSSARVQLAKARRDLGRTQVEAPFDALVLETSVELGQQVTPLTPLATLVATDRYWVEVSLPVARLIHLDIPGVNVAGRGGGSTAHVMFDAGSGGAVQRQGSIERLVGQVDMKGRMARVLITVDDPLDIAARQAQARGGPPPGLPLLIGSFVKVELEGAPLPDTTAVPDVALIDDKFVWLVVDDRLAARKVDVAWRNADTVLLRGLRPGDAVVTTALASPTEGMAVRIAGETTSDASKAVGGSAPAPRLPPSSP